MLEHFLVTQVFIFFILFCRIGSGIMLLPGFGETYVPQTIRLSFALVLCLLLTPFLGKTIPPMPTSVLALTLLIVSEILIGFFIGGICNIIISVTHIAGMIFSLQAGISSAVIYDVTQSSQGSLIGNFLGLLAIVLLFATNMHHLMLRGITESYSVFVPGHMPPINDFVEAVTRLISQVFTVAIEISAPLIVVSTLLFLGGGILSRLMPTVQIFFLITAPQLLINFFIIITAFTAMMLWYMNFFHDKLLEMFSYL